MNKRNIFYSLITLSIPTVLEEILTTLLQYVDTAMVGHLGEKATAAVSVTTTITWIVNSIPHAFAIASLALISKSVGSKDNDLIKKISKNLIILILACTLITGIPSILLSRIIPKWMGAEKAIRRDAYLYFLIISIPMLFRTTTIILGSAIRATGNTKTPMFVNFGANLVNVLLNAIFIYVLNMGVVGAAFGSAISYSISGILMYYFYRRNEMLRWEYKDLSYNKNVMLSIIKIGMPVLGTSFTSCLGYVFFARLVSGMGTTIFSAHSIAVTAEQLFYIPGYGLKTATSTMVGMALGEQDTDKMSYVGRVSTILTVGMMVFSGIVLFFIARPLMGLFTSAYEVKDLGAKMLRLVAFSEPFFGLMIVVEGIFNGLGKNQYAFVIETLSMWGIRILFTFLCVEIWKLDLYAVWYCMIADNVFKAIMLWIIKNKTYRKLAARLTEDKTEFYGSN